MMLKRKGAPTDSAVSSSAGAPATAGADVRADAASAQVSGRLESGALPTAAQRQGERLRCAHLWNDASLLRRVMARQQQRCEQQQRRLQHRGTRRQGGGGKKVGGKEQLVGADAITVEGRAFQRAARGGMRAPWA